MSLTRKDIIDVYQIEWNTKLPEIPNITDRIIDCAITIVNNWEKLGHSFELPFYF